MWRVATTATTPRDRSRMTGSIAIRSWWVSVIQSPSLDVASKVSVGVGSLCLHAFAARGVDVELGRLAAVKLGIVANHAHPAEPGAVRHREFVLEALGCGMVLP